MKILLSDQELATIQILSNLRNLTARANNVTDNIQANNLHPFKIDFLGLIGEYAFCKHFNTFLDITPKPQSKTIDTIYQNLNIDVKTTTKLNHGMFIASENPSIDIYALVVYSYPWAEIVGYIAANEAYKHPNHHGKGFYVPNTAIKTFDF